MGGNRNSMAKKKKTNQERKCVRGGGQGIWYEVEIDPLQLRFAHSRIRPVFSGCGREVTGTLEEIRVGSLSVCELPIITVIEGPLMDINSGSRWYFTMNNRRWPQIFRSSCDCFLCAGVSNRVFSPFFF